MTRTLTASLLIGSMLVVLWTTSSQACHWRRACQPTTSYSQSGYTYASPQGDYGAGGGYGMAGGPKCHHLKPRSLSYPSRGTTVPGHD
jgi:hypothetical protein